MSSISIDVVAGGNIQVSGEITFFTVNQALSLDFLSGQQNIKINLSGVTRSDSSGLALMVHWLRQARQQGVEMKFENIPDKLLALAKVSNLDEILPIVYRA